MAEPIDLSRYINNSIKKPATCFGCPGLAWAPDGYVPHAEGHANNNGVLLVGDYPGPDDTAVGKHFQGRAGSKLTAMLARKGLRRDQFILDNTLRCLPHVKIDGHPLEESALAKCAAHLDGTIARFRPKVIVPMGSMALRRVLGLSKFEKITPHRGYVNWSYRYNCWVIPTFHPRYVMMGKQNLENVVMSDIAAAVEIAARGFKFHEPKLRVDIPYDEFDAWVDRVLANPDLRLAYDIETPYKAKEEDESALDVEDPTFTILRIGFACEAGEGISIPWSPQYLQGIRRLMAGANIKLGWNLDYDAPRLIANGVSIGGEQWDLMWLWHTINSDLPKGLSFVVPSVLRDCKRWKHEAQANPGPYNALDAINTWRLCDPLVADAKIQQVWTVFDRHIVQLDKVLDQMSSVGVPVDNNARLSLSAEIKKELDGTDNAIQACVPKDVRKLTIYKKPVKDKSEGEWTTIGSFRVARKCAQCGQVDAKKPHVGTKTIVGPLGKRVPNPCLNAQLVEVDVPTQLDARVEPFVISNQQLTNYAKFYEHKVILNKENNPTFDEDAIGKLQKKYPRDPLYKLIVEFRSLQKLLTTYVGEWVGIQGQGESTGRVAAVLPQEQNQPGIHAEAQNVAEGDLRPGSGEVSSISGRGQVEGEAGGSRNLPNVQTSGSEAGLGTLSQDGCVSGESLSGLQPRTGIREGQSGDAAAARRLSGRWVGGMPVAGDGRVHTTYKHSPSTLRLSSVAPNLQNIPRTNLGKDASPAERFTAAVKTLFVAEEDHELVELDYSAIEAVLVGYLAMAVLGNEADAANYIRLAYLGVHDYVNSHILFNQKKISNPADLNWSDADLKAFFKDLKGRFPIERDGAKRTVHLSNYAGTPSRMFQAHPELFPSTKIAAELQQLYLDVCPAVRRWQEATIQRASDEGYLRNPFGYIHRFHSVYDWKLVDGKWESSWGEDAKRALAFLPQSTAAGIIKETMLRLYFDRDLGKYLRLQVHDSLVLMVKRSERELVTRLVQEEMEKPVLALPVDPKWGFGTHLAIKTEAKWGLNWGSLSDK
jgi:uracil-DNA glycosylase family 4